MLEVLVVCLALLPGSMEIDVEEFECSRFDYDRKMLQKIMSIEWDLKIITQQLADQKEILKDETTKRTSLELKLKQIESICSLDSTGTTYIRWGRASCPGNGTDLVYTGFAGGAQHDHRGAAANYLCLTAEPTWNRYDDTEQGGQTLWGAEYQQGEYGRNINYFFGKPLYEQDVPCSVCHTKRATLLMIPGRNTCYDGWTLEYHGYLTAGNDGHFSSEFVCLDDQPEILQGGVENRNGKLFYFTEARCGSLRCPPYVNGREITCVVCSK